MAAWSLLTRVLPTLEMLLLPPPEQLALHGVWRGAQQHSSTCRLAAPGSQEQGCKPPLENGVWGQRWGLEGKST